METIESPDLNARKQSLAAAIDDIYTAFKRYPLRPEITSSPYSDKSEQDKLLLAAPLRNLPGTALVHVAYSALTTWGSPEDFKHFLPRILELLVEDSFVDAEILFGKFRYGGWRHWLKVEQEAIERYLLAYWSRALAEFPCPLGDADDCLCAIAGALDDLRPLLNEWMHNVSYPALLHLTAFVMESAPRRLAHKKLANAFWTDERYPQMEQVIAWLDSDDLMHRVEKLFFLHCKDDLAQPLSNALSQLEALNTQRSIRNK